MKCIPRGRRANSKSTSPCRRPLPRVVVVDGQAGDYSAWQAVASTGQVQLEVVSSARDALRLCQTNPPDLWVVNAELADRSGFELCAMLKERSPRTPIYVVVDSYSVACERAAWQAKATMFVAKPGHHILLDHWLKNFAPSPTPVRAGHSHAAVPTHRWSASSTAAVSSPGGRLAASPRIRFHRPSGFNS